jgi:hypothetical protein
MWKTIECEPQYEVSKDGEVRNKSSKHTKSLRYNRDGYLRVTLYPSGKTHSIHRLVATAFITNKKNLRIVNHKDGVKTNNNVDNLEWCTDKENVNHAYRLGLNKFREISGEKNPSAKLDRVKVKEIRRRLGLGCSRNDLAKEFDVQYNCIKRIDLNITWK